MTKLTDEQFFAAFPDRQARIRRPAKELAKDKQRSVRYLDEMEMQFRHLGSHDQNRRRIIVWRIPRDNPHVDPSQPHLMKIPFLAFADETIADDDATLLPILDQMMRDAAQ